MKFAYAYKTPDGKRHEASMEAKCREDVFAALRQRGIKAIKVTAADGSKANGETRGVRKRVFVLCAVCLVLCAVIAAVVAFRAGESSSSAHGTRHKAQGTPTAAPRHQIYGDPVVMEDFERGKFESVLPRPGDRYLAWFAQPGRLMCPKGTSAIELRRMPQSVVTNLEQTLAADIPLDPADSREVTELKQIVNGMREELREYLANGNGTMRSFGRRLYERTTQEMQIYERTRRELERETDSATWKSRNDALRNLGLRTIPQFEPK